jgi:predicted CxxxxCH...CXXCH cytochrome family protein
VDAGGGSAVGGGDAVGGGGGGTGGGAGGGTGSTGGGGGGGYTVPDGGQLNCHLCHGTGDNPAPPLDLAGNTATTFRTVGAHQSHLKISTGWHRDVLCEDCHVVPQSTDNPPHFSTPPPAQMTFSPVANGVGAVASSWNGTTCTTYCHGATLGGKQITAPLWTTVNGSQAFCGACHGLPPPPPHAQPPEATLNTCGNCHTDYSPTGTGFPFSDPTRHINGVVDVNSACNSCHGNATNNAPPRDTTGNTVTTARGVGAHQPHLGTASTWHRDVLCADCHVVPTHVEDPGHLGPLPADLTWGPLAGAFGVTPAWSGTSCTVYCHGASMGGAQPTWTRVDGTQKACGTACHTTPPPAPHPPAASLSACVTCHSTMNSSGGFSAPQRHIDGVLDVSSTCNSCHGSATNNAPPKDVAGNVATTARGVGAHQSHLVGTGAPWHAPVLCADCHTVPVTLSDPGHIDTTTPGVAEVVFGAAAKSGGATPVWNGTTCTNSYCHGAVLDGGNGSNRAPTWTTVNGSQDACGTCHGIPPGGTQHQGATLATCTVCHGSVIAANGTWVNPALHIDGMVEASGGACGSCHDLPPATGAHLKHSALAAPTYGGLGTAATVTGATGYAFGCGQCHPIDGAKHINGTVEVELSNLNAPVGSLKYLSPSTASYTPGPQVLTDPKNPAIHYTLGTCGNVYCHSSPSFTASGVQTPLVDFSFTGYPVVYPPYTVNGSTISSPTSPVASVRTYSSIGFGAANPGCAGCHGFPIRLTSATDMAMAGQSHSWINAANNKESGHGNNHGFAPLACRTCHAQTVATANVTSRDVNGWSVYQPVPIAGFGSHVNGHPDVFFDTTPVQYLTSKSLTSATYNVATKTCSNVACHLAQTQVLSGNPFREQVGVECNACHQY